MKALTLQTIRPAILVVWMLTWTSLTASDLPELVLDPGGHTGEIVSLIQLPSRMEFVSCAHDGTIRFWDQSSGKLKRTLRLAHPYRTNSKILCADISPDEKVLAVGGTKLGSKGTVLIDLENGAQITSLSNGLVEWFQRPDITAVKFSPNGKTLVVGNSMGWLSQWTLPGEASDWLQIGADSTDRGTPPIHERRYINPSSIERITFSNSGKVIFAGCYNGALAAFPCPVVENRDSTAAKTAGTHWMRQLPGPVVSIHSLGDTSLLCGIENGIVQLLNPHRAELPERTIAKGTAGIHTIAIAASGLKYFVGGSMPCDAIVSNLNTANPQIHLEPGYHIRSITASAFLNDSVLATGDHEGQLFLWNTKTGQMRKNCSGSGNIIRMVAITQQGQIAGGKTLNERAIDLCALDMKKVPIPFYNLDWAFDPHNLTVSNKPEKFQSYSSPVTYRGKHQLSISEREGYHSRSLLTIWDYSIWKNTYWLDGVQHVKLPNPWDVYWFPPTYAHEQKGHYLLPGPEFLRIIKNNPRGIKFPYPASTALWSSQTDWVIAGGTNRVIRVYDKNSRQLLCSLFVNGPEDWVCWTPEMQYAGKGESRKQLGWVDQDPDTNMYQFHSLLVANRGMPDNQTIQQMLIPS